MHVTPETAEAFYEALRTMRPFRGWKLPHADDVQFVILPASSSLFGSYNGDDKKPDWHRISVATGVTPQQLLETMAHEMIHMKLGVDYYDKREPADHGKTFNRLADQVCRWCHFERSTF